MKFEPLIARKKVKRHLFQGKNPERDVSDQAKEARKREIEKIEKATDMQKEVSSALSAMSIQGAIETAQDSVDYGSTDIRERRYITPEEQKRNIHEIWDKQRRKREERRRQGRRKFY